MWTEARLMQAWTVLSVHSKDADNAGRHLDAANKNAQASAEHGATAVGHGITDAAGRAAGTIQGTFDKVGLGSGDVKCCQLCMLLPVLLLVEHRACR
jgi:hypothetical protein